VGLVWALAGVQPDKFQGPVQRIMYVHVPVAWVSFVAIFVMFVASIQYLRTRESRYDMVAEAAAAVGTLMCGLSLITGSIWGRYAWMTWWTWDARLTTVAVLFIIYVAYLVLRNLIDEESQRARFSAVLAILGFADVPIIHMSVVWWRTLHQSATVLQPAKAKASPDIVGTLLYMTVVFMILFAYMVIARRRMLEIEREAARLQIEKLQTAQEAV
jgi:heme exporter protein C